MSRASACDTARRTLAWRAAALHPAQRIGALAPIGNVGSARLDRQRQVERRGDARGGGPVGVEELRIDQVERLGIMKPAGERQHGARDEAGIEDRAIARDQREDRAMHAHPVFDSVDCRFGQRAVMAEAHRRHADGVDDRHLPVAARCQRFQAARDESAEARGGGVGIERRERQQALHSLRTSISATASQAGLSITSCR